MADSVVRIDQALVKQLAPKIGKLMKPAPRLPIAEQAAHFAVSAAVFAQSIGFAVPANPTLIVRHQVLVELLAASLHYAKHFGIDFAEAFEEAAVIAQEDADCEVALAPEDEEEEEDEYPFVGSYAWKAGRARHLQTYWD